MFGGKPLYQKDFIKNPDELFNKLMQLEWLEVTEARKEYFMSDQQRSYTYGKDQFAREYFSNPFLSEIKELVEDTYNVCFLNRYDNQKNQLGWHSDSSPTMDNDHPIAVISLGAEREIWWRKIGDKGVVPLEDRQLLNNGSLFIMPPSFQLTHQHRIPKCDHECGIRISLTYRRYKDN